MKTRQNNLVTVSAGLCVLLMVCVPSAQAGMIWNLDNSINHANAHAQSGSTGYCARYVTDALNAGGFGIQSNDAHLLGSSLRNAGFHESPAAYRGNWSGYTPRPGDVVIWGATDAHPYGHIETYTGEKWVSDWTQGSGNDFWTSDRLPTDTFRVYRYQDVHYQGQDQHWPYNQNPNGSGNSFPVEGPWIPEPATLALLALGGWVLTRRRK